jgi:hypothetical protein
MRRKGANRLDRTLLADIRDQAVSLSRLLTGAFPASRAAGPETRSRQIGPGASAAIKKPH